jgi:hypothetical protein
MNSSIVYTSPHPHTQPTPDTYAVIKECEGQTTGVVFVEGQRERIIKTSLGRQMTHPLAIGHGQSFLSK